MATAGVGPVAAEPLTKEQLRCVLALQASGEHVARVTIAHQLRCIGGKGPFATCMAGDPGRRLARSKAKTRAIAARRCTSPPPLGPADPEAVNDAASSLVRLDPLLGSTPDATLVRRDADRAEAACQRVLVREYARTTLAHHDAYRRCTARLLRTRVAPTTDDLRACLDADAARLAKMATRAGKRAAQACGSVAPATVVAGACRADTIAGVLACANQEARCCTCLSADRADRLGTTCVGTSTAPSSLCAAPITTQQSVARQWDEEILAAIRIDLPRPPVHARNLFHSRSRCGTRGPRTTPTADRYLHHETPTSRRSRPRSRHRDQLRRLPVLLARFTRSR